MTDSMLLKVLKPIAHIASGPGKKTKLLILIYHRVLDEPDYMRSGEVDKATFTWQMQLLSRYFNVLPLSEALRSIQNNALPARALSITFDDGYADNYTNALPILKQFELSATFFIANGYLNGGRMWNDSIIEAIRNFQFPELDLTPLGMGKFNVSDKGNKNLAATRIIQKIKYLPPEQREDFSCFIANLSANLPNNLMMNDEQVKYLHLSGMEIGGHTVSHPILANLPQEAIVREINENKIFLEKLTESPLRIFAYPNGKLHTDFRPEHRQIVEDAGYTAAVSTEWGVANWRSNFWQLPRFTPWDNTPLKFMFRIIRSYCFDLR